MATTMASARSGCRSGLASDRSAVKTPSASSAGARLDSKVSSANTASDQSGLGQPAPPELQRTGGEDHPAGAADGTGSRRIGIEPRRHQRHVEPLQVLFTGADRHAAVDALRTGSSKTRDGRLICGRLTEQAELRHVADLEAV